MRGEAFEREAVAATSGASAHRVAGVAKGRER
jgi:hypothetical protein